MEMNCESHLLLLSKYDIYNVYTTNIIQRQTHNYKTVNADQIETVRLNLLSFRI